MSLPEAPAAVPAVPGVLLQRVQGLSARRPVAARVVALAGSPDASARQVAAALVADVALAARVLALANSAAYSLSGRVSALPFAITVVGFPAVRAIAALAVAGGDGAADVPPDFWPRCRVTATAAAALADAFDLPAADAHCLGLLTWLGQAVMHQHDPRGYRALLAGEAVSTGDRAALAAAEVERYGVAHTALSGAALASWGFPVPLAAALAAVDEAGAGASAWTACLRTAVEVATRITAPDRWCGDLQVASGGVVTEQAGTELLVRVRRTIAEDGA